MRLETNQRKSMYGKKKIHIFISENKKKYALTPQLRFK